MLTLLYGADRLELSRTVFADIEDGADQGVQGQILIVPEQFSHEAERKLCAIGGDTINRYAEVLSFSRLCDRLSSIYGGAARGYLDKGGQLLAMALAAEQVSSRIKYYASVLRKPEFLSDMVRIIGEFCSYCLKPEQLLEASRYVGGQFSLKLEELALLYEAYLAVCSNVAADPSDKLKRLLEYLCEYSWAADKTVFVDGFSDFTGAEMAVLEQLILGCKHVVIAIPGGPVGTALEDRTDEQLLRLRRLAEKHECRIYLREVAPAQYRERWVNGFLRDLFYAGASETTVSQSVTVHNYSSVEEECVAAALYVKELLSEGVRCRDISVAYTNSEQYEASLRSVFRTADLPVYVAGEVDILANPVVGAVMNSLFAAVGPMDYEDTALYLKSGLPGLDRDRCDRLDNYAYLWNLKGTQWEKEWSYHPRGFVEIWNDEDRVLLEQLNREKEVAMKPLLRLRRDLFAAKDTGEMVLRVHGFMEQLELRERLEQQANQHGKEGNGQLAQELLQIYDILISALEQMWMTIGKTRRTPEDFCKLYQMLLSQYRVATIPAGVDQVHISNLPDLRYKKTKHLLVLGASDGCFPSYKTAEGILTEDERKKLLNQGLSMAPGRADQMDLEMLKIYQALCAAETGLRISYAGDQPAWLLRRASELVENGTEKGEQGLFLDLDTLASIRVRNQDESDLIVPGLKELENYLRMCGEYRFNPLRDSTVRKLYGSPLMLSPSKIDQFAACRFEYYLQYGLKAKARKQAKLDQPAFGTFVHAVLEHTVLRVKELGGFHVAEKEQVLEIALEEIRRYAEELFPEQADQDQFLFARSQNEILDIVEDLWNELRNSLFCPEYCELKFAKDGVLPLIEIRAKTTDCRITGTIDRVDLFETEDQTYVRVVDYKTGRKSFDYTDILYGAGLQMLVYLFALREFGSTCLQTGELEPAGVLYLPARKDYPLTGPMPDDSVVDKEHRENRKRKGLIRCDEEILTAMEADPYDPQYMPYKYGKKGFSGDLADQKQMHLLERHVIRTIENMADQIMEGVVTPNPVHRAKNINPCRYCDYKTVCHKDLGMQQPRILAETKAKQFWEKLEQEERDHG